MCNKNTANMVLDFKAPGDQSFVKLLYVLCVLLFHS